MDYPCGKFGDYIVLAVFVLSCGQTHTQTDADERYTPATLVGVSKEQKKITYIARKIGEWVAGQVWHA